MLGLSQSLAQNASSGDKQFVRSAIETNNAEISMAHLALQKSDNARIKHFAEHMIRDHSRLNKELTPLAAKLGIQEPSSQTSQQQQEVASRLQGLRGRQFDEQYAQAMVQGHRQALQQINEEISTGHSASVKRAAEKAKPIVQEHLRLAESLTGHTKR